MRGTSSWDVQFGAHDVRVVCRLRFQQLRALLPGRQLRPVLCGEPKAVRDVQHGPSALQPHERGDVLRRAGDACTCQGIAHGEGERCALANPRTNKVCAAVVATKDVDALEDAQSAVNDLRISALQRRKAVEDALARRLPAPPGQSPPPHALAFLLHRQEAVIVFAVIAFRQDVSRPHAAATAQQPLHEHEPAVYADAVAGAVVAAVAGVRASVDKRPCSSWAASGHTTPIITYRPLRNKLMVPRGLRQRSRAPGKHCKRKLT